MARWEPNARGRLEQAALELFHERGYSRTTVEEIAARAGLTERTFFRYFTDKREVLFWGAGELQQLITDAIPCAPATTALLDAVAAAIGAAAPLLQGRREYARTRRDLIAAHAELREREQMKLTSLAADIAMALRERGVAEPEATLAAEAGIAVFKVAFERWIEDTAPRDLTHHLRAALDALRAVVTGVGPSSNKSTSTGMSADDASSTPRTQTAPRSKSPRRRRTAG